MKIAQLPGFGRSFVRRVAAASALALLGGALVAVPSAHAASTTGLPTDPNITFVGRWDTSNSSAYVPYWAGAYFIAGFTGTSVTLRQRNAIDLYASIDGGAYKNYSNVSGNVNLTPTRLASGNHVLRVTYRVVAGSYHGDAVFQGLTLDSGALTWKVAVQPKLIEFVGDSITVGQLTSQVQLTSYAWRVGDQLGTRHTQIAQGGACLVATADGCVGLEAQFPMLNPNASTPAWNFSRYTANAVVINLGTNDVGHGVHTPQFQTSYIHLLQEVRTAYPNAAIFAMETFKMRFNVQTQAAVAARNAAGDSKVYYINTEGWLVSTDFVDGTHPNDGGDVKVANKLAPIISAHI